MDPNKMHQEQNTILQKTVNQLKIELRKSKHEVFSLRNQLHSSHERNTQLTEQQADLFNAIEQFESRLDEVFATNSFSYILLSTSIQEITSKMANGYKTHLAESINVSNRCANQPTSSTSTQSIATASGKPHQSVQHPADDDILNTAFLNDSHSSLDMNSVPARQQNCNATEMASRQAKIEDKENRTVLKRLLKMQSRTSDPYTRSSTNSIRRRTTDDPFHITPILRHRRSADVIDYREPPINRKMRRID